jgi:CO/xanthine dehydrogenase FAD-binding subunit
MRAFVPNYKLVTPASLNEALALLATDSGEWRPFAGGTDLMVLLEAGKLPHLNYVNIWNLPELRSIEVTDSAVSIGALTTYSEIQAHELLRKEFPMLGQAASETGGLAIQNRGTLGGNIANASPAADSPPALLAYDATIELISAKGTRTVSYKDFHTGYKQMTLRPDELVARIHLPRTRASWSHFYRKVGTRKAQAISKICFAAVARMEGKVCVEVRIALGSVAPIPLRCVQTENVIRQQVIDEKLIAQAVNKLAQEISPISDIRSTRDYRLRVSQNLLEDFLRLQQTIQ